MAETLLPPGVTVTVEPTGLQTTTITAQQGEELLTPEVAAYLAPVLYGRRISTITVVNDYGGSLTEGPDAFTRDGLYPLSPLLGVQNAIDHSNFREAGIPLRRATVVTIPTARR